MLTYKFLPPLLLLSQKALSGSWSQGTVDFYSCHSGKEVLSSESELFVFIQQMFTEDVQSVVLSTVVTQKGYFEAKVK